MANATDRALITEGTGKGLWTFAATIATINGYIPAQVPVTPAGASIFDSSGTPGFVNVVNFPATQPVSIAATVNVAVTSIAAGTNYVGRVRQTDGTLDLTLLNAAPAADTGQVAVPVRLISELPHSRRATYYATTAELTLGTAVGQNRIISLFHPAAIALTYEILEMVLYFKQRHTVGVGQYKFQFITAENASPGGTQVTPQTTKLSRAASGALVRAAPTGAPTATGTVHDAFTGSLAAIGGNVEDMQMSVYHFTNGVDGEEPLTMRPSTAEGVYVYQDVTSILTGAPIVAARIKWVEY